MLESVKLEDIRNKTICRLCGSDKTHIKNSNGSPIWKKDKNSYGERTGQYLCYDCAHPNIETRKCYICGDNKILYRAFDADSYWTGKYECKSCIRKRSIKIK